MEKEQKYNSNYDLIKIIGILGVITIHIFLGSRHLFHDKFTINWYVSIFIYIISRFSVPLFFMVSGALLLPKKAETIKVFIKKRLLKITIPLIFWTVFYYFFFYLLEGRKNVDWARVISWPITLVHLWYLYVLLGLYLLTPLYRVMLQNSSTKMILYYIALWFVFAGFHVPVDYFFHINLGEGYGLFPNVLSSYTGYYFLGYLLTDRIRDIKIKNKWWFSMFILGVFSSFILNIYENIPNKDIIKYNDYFLIFTNWNIIFLTVPVFIWLNRVKINTTKWTSELGSAVFGIYLIHEAVLQGLRRVNIIQSIDSSVCYWIVFLVLTFVISYLFVRLIRVFNLKII